MAEVDDLIQNQAYGAQNQYASEHFIEEKIIPGVVYEIA